MIEVLEHVKKDIKLLQMLPPGQNVVITVPNYPANNHVRYFAEISSVIERYRGVVEILDLETYKSKGTPDNSIFVIVGKIRNVRLNHIKDVKKVIGLLPSTIDVTSIIEECVTLGSNCDIGPGCVIGSKSVGAEFDEVGDLIEFPQCGKVTIKDNVKIRSQVVIDRSTDNSTATVIEDNCIIGPMAHIGHNVKVGRNSMVLGNSVICGGVKIGERCTIGAGSVIKNKVKIGDGSIVGLGAVVTKDVPGGWVVTGNPSRKLEQ
jgi:acetyltransferase-like isoleucine patch superfamily enzyme